MLREKGWTDGNLPSDWVFVSICDRVESRYERHLLSGCGSVVNLDFDDIAGYRVWDAIPDYNWDSAAKDMYKDVYGMTDEQASELFSFLDGNVGKNVMVHCAAGVSRSQGVVRFLLDMYPDVYRVEETNPKNPCLVPNGHVVRLLKREYYKRYGLLTGDC